MTSHVNNVPLIIGEQKIDSAAERWGDVFNPSTGEVIARVPMCMVTEVDRAVRCAADALPAWRATPVVERARVMFRYVEMLEKQFEPLAQLVTREHGKTLAEARAEVRRGIEVVEFAAGMPSLIMGQTLADIATGVDAETVRHPVGVCAGITPYNFPAMVPMWMFPIAITCGNTFVLKPSQTAPLAAMRVCELLHDAGLPAGVINVVHGDHECVNALLTHPTVAVVSFVGSTPVAHHVYKTASHHGKRVQAAGGAKNHLVIMPDADMDLAVKALGASAFGCAGQRCMAGSVAIAVGDAADALVSQMCDHADSLRVGPTDGDENIDIGPVIRTAHRDRVAGYLDIAQSDGATVALDGRHKAAEPGFVIGPSVLDYVTPAMRVWKEEIFGPVLSVVRAASLDEALTIADDCEFGNGASIFTRDGYAARQFKQHFNAGMIGINVGVPAPMAWFPFTGWNRSFFGDLHIQGQEAVHFYTRQKMTLTRWFAPAGDTHHDPVWKSGDHHVRP